VILNVPILALLCMFPQKLNLFNFHLNLADLIVVNLTYPERNREVQVFCFENYRDDGTGDIVNGFQIMVDADVRDYEKDLFKLEIVHDNELLLHMPSLPYHLQYDSALRHRTLVAMELLSDRCQEAQEICISDILSATSRQKKKLRLRFPEGICLANMESLDSVLPLTFEPYKYPTTIFGPNTPHQWVCSVSWMVANLETRRKAQGSAVKSTTAKLSDLFGRMSTG
jgi:hypothetical protein